MAESSTKYDYRESLLPAALTKHSLYYWLLLIKQNMSKINESFETMKVKMIFEIIPSFCLIPLMFTNGSFIFSLNSDESQFTLPWYVLQKKTT